MIDTFDFPVVKLSTAEMSKTIQPKFIDSDTNHLHIYFSLYEVNPISFFLPKVYVSSDSTVAKNSKSIFIIQAAIFNSLKKIQYYETMYISGTQNISAGIGFPYIYNTNFNFFLLTSPSGFKEMIKKAIDLLLTAENDLSLVEMKMPLPYVYDNFIFPAVFHKNRTFIVNKKDVSQFVLNDSIEIIRMGEKQYEEIKIKGKSARNTPAYLLEAIKQTPNYFNSDYVYLKQDGRDVLRDINYQLKLCVQIDPDFRPANPEFLFTNFLSGKYHFQLNNKDTVATFIIEQRKSNWINRKIKKSIELLKAYPKRKSNVSKS